MDNYERIMQLPLGQFVLFSFCFVHYFIVICLECVCGFNMTIVVCCFHGHTVKHNHDNIPVGLCC